MAKTKTAKKKPQSRKVKSAAKKAVRPAAKAKKAPAKKPQAKKAAPAAKKPQARKVTPAAKKPQAKGKAVKAPVIPDLDGYVRRLPPPVKVLVAGLRKLVKDVAPFTNELTVDSDAAFEANGVFARIQPSDRDLVVAFLRGGDLKAPEGVLEGEAGPYRYVTIKTPEELKAEVLRSLVRQAVMINIERAHPGIMAGKQ